MSNDTTRFYVIEEEYIGPGCGHRPNDHWIDIRTVPVSPWMKDEPVIEGHVHTINSWSVDAHGEFDTMEAALEKVKAVTFGEKYEITDVSETQDCDLGIEARFGFGRFPQMTVDEVSESIHDEIEKLFLENPMMATAENEDSLETFLQEIIEDYEENCGVTATMRTMREAVASITKHLDIPTYFADHNLAPDELGYEEANQTVNELNRYFIDENMLSDVEDVEKTINTHPDKERFGLWVDETHALCSRIDLIEETQAAS